MKTNKWFSKRDHDNVKSLTEITGKGLWEILVELCTMSFLETSAQTEITEFQMTLKRC